METAGSVALATHPFERFPEEIWEMILEELEEDTQTLLNVFSAIPQLAPAITKKGSKSFSWKIGFLMPLLAPKYLNFSDILKCRLVSKRWKGAVDLTLENHPDRKPYQIPTAGTAMSSTHFNYQSLPKFKTKGDLLRDSRLRNQILKTPRHINPFIGRSLTLATRVSRKSSTEQLNPVLPLLNKFGHHIWYASFHLEKSTNSKLKDSAENTIQILLQCLSYLPNLKSLKVKANFSYRGHSHAAAKITQELWGTENNPILYNFLPTLDTLDLTVFKCETVDMQNKLVKALAGHGQVKKLMVDMDFWDPTLGCLFPNLVELHVTSFFTSRDEFLDRTRHVLDHLRDASQLQKLSVIASQLDITKLLEFLAPYRIRAIELVIKNDYSSICRFDNADQVSSVLVPSIKEIKLEDDFRINFNFLHQLPSLEYLNIVPNWATRRFPWGETNSFGLKSKYSFSDSVYVYLLKDPRDGNQESIWKKMENLKALNLYKKNKSVHEICRRFVRENELKTLTGKMFHKMRRYD